MQMQAQASNDKVLVRKEMHVSGWPTKSFNLILCDLPGLLMVQLVDLLVTQ